MNKTLEVRCYSKIIIEFKDGWERGWGVKDDVAQYEADLLLPP